MYFQYNIEIVATTNILFILIGNNFTPCSCTGEYHKKFYSQGEYIYLKCRGIMKSIYTYQLLSSAKLRQTMEKSNQISAYMFITKIFPLLASDTPLMMSVVTLLFAQSWNGDN